MIKKWTIEFGCGMTGCDEDTFLEDIVPDMDTESLLDIVNKTFWLNKKLNEEYIKRCSTQCGGKK